MPLCRHPDATPYSLLHIIDQRALDSVVTLAANLECKEDETAKGLFKQTPLPNLQFTGTSHSVMLRLNM